MGERYRNRPYYDQSHYDQSQHRWAARDEEARRRERRDSRSWEGSRDYEPRYAEQQDTSGYPGPFGWTQDPDVDRDFGAGNEGYRSGYRDYNRGERQRFEEREPYRSRYGQSSGYGSGGSSSGYGSSGYGSSGYGSSGYGSDWRRPALQSGGYPQRDFGHSYREEGYSVYGPQDRDERGFGQQLRDAGHRIAQKVKRVFRGPKGYKRSDERIREDVNDRLSQQDHFDPSDIEVSVSNSEVTLTGTVRSRGEKFIAEEIADDVSGVTEVHNQLRVKYEQTSPTASSTTESQQSTTSQQSFAERNRNSRSV